MQILAGWTRVVAVCLVGASLAVAVGRSQLSGSETQQGVGKQTGAPDPKDPCGQNQPDKSKMDQSPFGTKDARLAIARNDERQKKLVSDSDKLLQLATQLHDEVAKTDQHILSVDVMRRAE